MNVNVLTMSSTEIVELTSKEHSKVMANIRKVLSEVEFSAVYKDQLIDRPCFHLAFRETNLIIKIFMTILLIDYN